MLYPCSVMRSVETLIVRVTVPVTSSGLEYKPYSSWNHLPIDSKHIEGFLGAIQQTELSRQTQTYYTNTLYLERASQGIGYRWHRARWNVARRRSHLICSPCPCSHGHVLQLMLRACFATPKALQAWVHWHSKVDIQIT